MPGISFSCKYSITKSFGDTQMIAFDSSRAFIFYPSHLFAKQISASCIKFAANNDALLMKR